MAKEDFSAAANVVSEQTLDNPGVGIPVDPDVAEFMGAFSEESLSLSDLMDDVDLSINAEGEAVYEG